MISADEMEIIKEQAYSGYPSMLKDVCEVYPSMMRDLLKNSAQFSGRVNLLTLNEEGVAKLIKQKTGKDVPLEKINVFDYLLYQAENSESFFLELYEALSTFIKEDIYILPSYHQIVIGPPEEKRLITKENFSDFQTILRLQNRREVPEPPPENEDEYDRRLRLLKAQREAVKRKQQQKEGNKQELADLLEIAEVFGVNTMEKSVYAFYGLVHRYQMREKWDQDIAMLCAGADSSKIKTKYWGENPEED